MRTLLTYLPGLVCAGGMFLCMRMMRGGSKDESCHAENKEASVNTEEMAELHEEVTRLRAEIRLRDKQDL